MAREKVGLRGGRVFKTMGDAVLADFASPVNALRCAVEMRSALAENTEGGMQMRFGLHLADVIESGEDLIGDGVNLAARIQAGASGRNRNQRRTLRAGAASRKTPLLDCSGSFSGA